MERFKDYLDLKLSDDSFYQAYFGECAICPITVEIIKSIDESSKTAAEIALECGVEESVIENLRDADKCCVNSVKIIAEYFHIPPPKDCLKDRVKS